MNIIIALIKDRKHLDMSDVTFQEIVKGCTDKSTLAELKDPETHKAITKSDSHSARRKHILRKEILNKIGEKEHTHCDHRGDDKKDHRGDDKKDHRGDKEENINEIGDKRAM